MRKRIVDYLRPPDFPNNEFKATAARVLNLFLLSILATLILWAIVAIPFFVERKAASVVALVSIGLVMLSLHAMMRSGRVALASKLFLLFWWTTLTFFAVVSGGIHSIAIGGYISLVVMAGTLLGAGESVRAALLSGVISLGIVIAEQTGWLPEPYFPARGLAAWFVLMSILVWTGIPLYVALRDLRRANQISHQQLEEIRQIDRGLRESEQRFRMLVEAAFEGIGVTKNGVIIDLNDQLAEMLGYTREELIGKPVAIVLSDEDRQLVTGIIESGNIEPNIHVALHKEGAIFPVMIRSRTVDHAQGSLRLTAVRDMTQQIEAERTLRASEQRYRRLFESNPMPMWVYDLETLAYLAVNEAAVRKFGYSREEFLAMTIKDIRPEEEIPKLLENIQHISGGIDEAGIWRLRKKDGTIIFVEITSHTLEFNGRPAEMVLGNDVTEKVRSLEALEKERAFLRQVIDAVPGFVFVKDLQSRYVLANKALAEAYGTTVEAMIGKTEADFYVDADEIKRRSDLDREVIRSRKPLFIPEAKVIDLTGEQHWLATNLVPLFDHTGELTYFMAITMDITARKEIEASLRASEEEVRKLNAELEQRVFERTEQLASANHELEAFSYTVSHDLRAPLRAIDGYSRILLEDHRVELSPDAEELLRIVRQNTRFMSRLIDGLLAYSRLGRQPLNRQEFSSAAIVVQELDKLVRDHPEQKIEAVVGELPVSQGDPLLIRQVWANLLSNAVKFSSGRETIHIEINSRQVKGEQIFSVRDNGVGFDMQYANQLFRVFQSLHSREEFEGTGVGLAIVEWVVRRHGGRVWAESEVDQGATFFFSLPVPESIGAIII